jgi:3-phenylpropionate/trans-cinnamate dioxygenase ferredoxin subunit
VSDMSWVPVAEAASFQQGGGSIGVAVECKGCTLAVFRVGGQYFALDDVCSHEYSRLSEGEILDGEVYCPKHGSRFDLRTGEVRGLPATQPVNTYEVKEEDGKVWVLWDR